MFDSIQRLLAAISLPFATLDAQEEEFSVAATKEQPEEEEQAERFSIGSYYTAFESPSSQQEVQLQLKEQGHEMSKAPQGGGGGLLITRGKVVIDSIGSGAGGMSDDERSFGYGQGLLNLGYILAQNRLFRIYPLLGVGGGGGGEANEAETDQQDELSEDAHPVEQIGFGMFNAGLGIDLTLRFWRLSLFAGLRVGVGIQVDQARAIVPKPFLRVITGASLHI